jgi:hypothetical protein
MPMLRILLGLLLIAPLAQGGEEVQLRTLDGKTLKGDLIRITESAVTLSGDTGPVSTPVANVLDIALPAGPPGYVESGFQDLELTDGSLLHCRELTIKKDQVEAKLLSGQDVRLPLKAVSYVLNNAQDSKTREEWQTVLAQRKTFDVIAIRDKEGKVNPLEGTLGQGDDAGARIGFETSAGTKRELPIARLVGLAFLRRPDADAPAVVCKVSDTSRDGFAAARLTFEADRFTVATAGGAKVELPRDLINRLDFSQGKLAYLSDLEPVKVSELYLEGSGRYEGFGHYRRDKNWNDGPIRLLVKGDARPEPQTFVKGLALHTDTELVYDLGGQYKEFKAYLGVDPKVEGDWHVRVTIEGDGKSLFTGEVQRGGDPLPPLKCDVTGVKQLRIVVSPARLLDLGGHVNLADAKVSK